VERSAEQQNTARVRRFAKRIAHALIGRQLALPHEILARYPELRDARWRSGGLPPRIGGWFLARSTVAGITLGRTIWLAPGTAMEPDLLLHEFCHVRQFGGVRAFPLLYCWESLRRGYTHNRFEAEANAFAHRVIAERAAAGRAITRESVDTPAEGP
jgi:hypothetical protein